MKKNPVKFLLCLCLWAGLRIEAAEKVYAGYYRGASVTNSFGVLIEQNVLYSFTDLANPIDSAEQVRETVFLSNWTEMAFDGTHYYSFLLTPTRQGPGLYQFEPDSGITLSSSNSASGTVYSFSDWHGIGVYGNYFYGLYNGSGMDGPGLYRFTDPSDPENTGERLFAPQTFSSDLWRDVAFDGTDFLFVRNPSAGNPGVYRYDSEDDSFGLIAGTETYTNWDGLSVYNKKPVYATGKVYAGYYRGASVTNSSGVFVEQNVLYSFTDITNPIGSAEQVRETVFLSNWTEMAFDGTHYYSFLLTPTRQGPGLYQFEPDSGIALSSSNSASGTVYSFSDWHGIGVYGNYFYGLYDGSGIDGPGLYRFTDPSDPENTGERLFAPQAFSSDLWRDVAFDGTDFLFVRDPSAGNPGIYRYDSEDDSFSLVSGPETYANWDGLSVYNKKPVYAGYYRGASVTNSSGTVVEPNGLYAFTDLLNPVDTAVRIGSTGFGTNWKELTYDGISYQTFLRNTVRSGPGMYRYDLGYHIFLNSSNLVSGTFCTFSDWHGLGFHRSYFYGLYSGSGMDGPGLYRFTDPADPENTGERLFAPQTFSSDLWEDLAFDGTDFLFVRNPSAGDPGIYRYDSENDSFELIDGTEAYSGDWDGFSAYADHSAVNEPLLNKTVYVVFLGGQSNGMGWGYPQYLSDTGNPLVSPQEDVGFFAAVGVAPCDRLVPLQSGFGNAFVKAGDVQQYPELTGIDALNHFGPELTLGRTLRDRITIPDTEIVIIKHCHSNTSIYEDWLPDGTADDENDGPKYQDFQMVMHAGLNAVQDRYPDYNVKILGMAWVQGEADAISTQSSNYQANLTAFIQDIRTTYGSQAYGTNFIFVLSKLSPNQSTSTDFDIVRAAQDAVAATLPDVVATDTSGIDYPVATGYAEGSYHYLSIALLHIGEDLANAILDTAGLDSDNDGLPDEWENSYAPGILGLGTSLSSDYDGDGMTDIQEYRIDTDPTDASDRFLLAAKGMKVSWSAKKNICYQMLGSTNLVSWKKFGDSVLLRNSNDTVSMDFSDSLSSNNTYFFKLQAQ